MIGTNINATPAIPPKALDLLYKAGIRAARLWVNGEEVIKARDSYDFSSTIAAVKRLRDAGFFVYANWSGIPAFMSENLPAYGPFSCWVEWKPGDPEPYEMGGAGRWRFARPSEKPYCHMPNVPNVDAQQVEAFTYALASETGGDVDWFGSGNEYDLRDFWPPIADPDYKNVGYRRAVEQVFAPAARGFRRAMPGGAVQLIGPESATAGGMGMLCELEEEMGLRLFDVLSGHFYAWGPWPENAYERTEEFITVWREHGHGRPLWNTENDSKGAPGYVDWLKETTRRHGDTIGAHFRFEPWRWFKGGADEWNAGRFVPNQDYRDLQVWLEGGSTIKKRRAVRT